MKENNELISDDFLKNLVGKSSLDSPSDAFVGIVMEKILPQPEIVPVKRSFFLYLKTFFGFLILAAVVGGFFWTSDIPVLSWLPGKEYFNSMILPVFDSLLAWVNHLLENGKSFSIPVMIIAASGLFFLLDRLLALRNRVRNFPAA